jgi:diguanylate cyclase (GGDEF)-like protein
MMKNKTIKDMTLSEQEMTCNASGNAGPGSELPDMDLTGKDHQPGDDSRMEQPAISDFAAVADEFNAAFSTALYELDSSRKQLAERSGRIDELNESIKSLNSALNDEVNKGRGKQEEYSRETEQLNQKIDDIESDRERLLRQVSEQESTLNARAGEISQLSSRVEEVNAALEQHPAEHQHAQEELVRERDILTGKLDELQVLFDVAGNQREAHQKKLEDRDNEISSIRKQLGELGAHTANLENLNRALHESSISENTLHKKLIKEKNNKIELLQTRLGSGGDSQNDQPENTEEKENLQRALNDLESRLQETEAQKQVFGERARLADELEAEAGQLRAALQEVREANSTDAQSLQGELADLNPVLENSRAEQEVLAGKLRDHEALEQEVSGLREALQQADKKLLERVDVSNTVDSLKDEVKKLKSALSASEEMRDQSQSSLPGSFVNCRRRKNDAPAPEQDPQSIAKIADRDQFTLHLDKLITGQVDTDINSNVMYLLVDNFIRIRDEIGIMNSAHVINEIAEIIVSSCDDDTVSRFGDCTFAVLTCNESPDETQAKAEKIRSMIEKHIFETPGHSMVVTTSIGICSVRKNDTCAENVISRADLACESARSSGGNQVLVNSAIADEMVLKSSTENHEELISATLNENRIMLYYQPISCLKDVPGNHYEVLIRVVDESGGVILPGEFFSMAGTSGQTEDIDRHIIEKIMQMMFENRDQEMTLFIKLTSQSVADHELPLWIIEKIKEYKVNPEQLVFEVAESTLQSDLKNLSMLSKALNSIGCKIAIEHYRMSTQPQHLLHIHADYLKIDSGLVEGLSRSGGSYSKVAAIMDIAREHNYITIAEGVENPASLAILWELGVGLAQGYFIQAPTGNRDYNFQGIVEESEKEEDGSKAVFDLG